MKEVPNILTFFRIAIIPVLLCTLYFETSTAYWVAAALFGVASITDYFDGKLARIYNAHSSLGKVLDPIADKLLVASTLMLLVHFGRAPIIPAILILCREILVSGLREHLSEFQISIPVSRLGKIKTAIQFCAILLLILGSEATGLRFVAILGDVAIWIAAALTVFTGYSYCKEGFNKIV